MPHPEIDRRLLRLRPLRDRANRVAIERDHVSPDAPRDRLSDLAETILEETAERIRQAREFGKARMLVFGAHTIKNGLAPVLIALIEEGWITHLATNGAGIIHDWEFAYLGESSEHVEANVRDGAFGLWDETGRYINLALAVGAAEGFGYGESIGALIENEGLIIPSSDSLLTRARNLMESDSNRAAAAIDLLGLIREFGLEAGPLAVAHPFKRFGVQAAAYRLNIPFTGHPMIGHDIIYLHPMNRCAAIGRAAQRDFLRFAHSVSQLDGGVYLSVGSAVMSPMVFEKSLAMAQNLALQKYQRIEKHFMVIVDMAKSHWDWSTGEPPEDNPDYYLRYNKTFSRMGGTMRYASADNRDFLLGLLQGLRKK